MAAKKILYISQFIDPYVPASPISIRGRELPQKIQDMGNEIRTFIPKWGNINERRHQLHEVIRLSGLNVIIDDTDHPLIIKVATLQSAHMQVYFIDSEDYFLKRLVEVDKNGKEYKDNYERSIFYTRSVLETVKKLRWFPDIIHCHGWISATAPFYIKTTYKEDPAFENCKVVYSLDNFGLKKPMPANFKDCLAFRNYTTEVIDEFGMKFKTCEDFEKFAVKFSDAVIMEDNNLSEDIKTYIKSEGKAVMDYDDSEDVLQHYNDFYQSLFTD